MFITIKMQCPYCDFNNKINIEVGGRESQHEAQVVTCDNDSGGCDQDFVMYSTMNIAAYAKAILDD